MENENGLIDSQDQIVDDPNKQGDSQGEPKGDSKEGEPKTEGTETGAKEQGAADPATGKPAQTPEENSAFRDMRLKMEQMEAEKAQVQRDAIYAKKYPDLGIATESELKALYGDEGIETYEDLDSYFENIRQAEKMEVSPELLKTLNDLTAKVETLTKEKENLLGKEEAKQAKKDMAETYGDIFTKHEDEITALAEKMGMMNARGIKAATATVLADKFPSILKEMNEKLGKAKEDGVKEYFDKKKNETPVEGSGTPPASVGTTSQDSWKVARQSAIQALKGE